MMGIIENWGKPDGIAGSINSLEPEEAKKEADKILFYKIGLVYSGGHFELLREPQHTDEDVENAKKWLRKNQDVVSIKVTKQLV